MPLMKCAICDRLMVSDQLVCTSCREANTRYRDNKHAIIVAPGLILLIAVPLSYVFGPFAAGLIILLGLGIVYFRRY